MAGAVVATSSRAVASSSGGVEASIADSRVTIAERGLGSRPPAPSPIVFPPSPVQLDDRWTGSPDSGGCRWPDLVTLLPRDADSDPVSTLRRSTGVEARSIYSAKSSSSAVSS